VSLQVTDLRVYYRTLAGDVKALDGATFSIADKEIMGLAGESGCGKSTLGNSLIRLDGRMKYIGGSVNLDGQDLPIWDKRMNRVPLPGSLVIPQYAMSAMNPTRKIGKMIRAGRVAGQELRRDQGRAAEPHRPRRADRTC
jgi:peptide/nickel transport system ATP-binding protein